jgi:hypothetical protein
MNDDISDAELVKGMKDWAEFEDNQDRLVPFRDACTAIVRALGSNAPQDLELSDLPDLVATIVEERDGYRTAGQRQALQALSDEGQYEDNYQARLAAEAKLGRLQAVLLVGYEMMGSMSGPTVLAEERRWLEFELALGELVNDGLLAPPRRSL